MTSREERGAYGFGRQVKNWDTYSPLGHRVTPFPEEKVCGICESKCDVVFPVAPKLCGRCAMHAIGRSDVMNKWRFGPPTLSGYHCDNCGQLTYRPLQVNTRICHPCTSRLGNQVQKNQMALMYGARRVV